ncbi:chromosome segregation ATPase [Oxynema sp. CENA135]|uniref:chromosome segregation ATPase n=1 Tax=Oxynema sp. CENA135 TaxID=984206 RepID=UPI00190CB6E8|nr:chromosome segregation ATPase [Oxynema sp. CENA135]MBK4728306.1 chromosome segregation ATPase [Oxynema sp. CENA135]
MTNNHELPDRWQAARSSNSDRPDLWSGLSDLPKGALAKRTANMAWDGAATPSHLAASHSPRDSAPLSPRERNSAVSSSARPGKLNSRRPRRPQPETPRPLWMKWVTSWPFWALLTLVVCGGLGTGALMMLLRLPAIPNCSEHFGMMSSAGDRLYCAQRAANRQNADGLLDAIAILNKLPQDHPLRPEINRQIEKWSVQLLDRAEETFNQGKLSEAIAVARQIPTDVPAANLVEERIARWESIWKEAEDLYKKAEAALEKENWGQAYRYLRQLPALDNTYWATTQYDALAQLIETTREDGNILNKARDLADRGGIDNLNEAIKIVEQIDPKSKVYKESRSLINDLAKQILALARQRLDERNSQDAIYIARQVPANTSVKKEAEDFVELARAQGMAWRSTVQSLEDAIAKARQIGSDRPLYREAQQSIAQWQQSIQDVGYLERARDLAQLGSVRDLRAAIAEAQLVRQGNPQWQEAKQEIDRWNEQIQITEDRPYLQKATDMARYGDRASLMSAIEIARKIPSNRALHDEAQGKIDAWTDEIERMEDQPTLDRAWATADRGDLKAAISIAETISPGRLLYSEAQSAIDVWEGQIRDGQLLDRAYKIGDAAVTSIQLTEAIDTANQISTLSPLRASADAAIDDWSRRLLDLAQEQSVYDLEAAIQLAQKVPYYSSAYRQAQNQIEGWQLLLAPPPIPEPDVATPSPQTPAPTATPNPLPVPTDEGEPNRADETNAASNSGANPRNADRANDGGPRIDFID